MLRKVLAVSLTLGLILSSAGAVVTVAQTDKWPDKMEDAESVSPGTYTGTIDSSGDVDYLVLAVEEGDTVQVTLEKEIRKSTRLYVALPGASDYLGDEYASEVTGKFTSEADGVMYIRVYGGYTDSESEGWSVTITRNEGEDTWNDDRDDAEQVSPGNYSGAVNSPDDTDYLKMPVDKGDTVTITLDKPIRKDVRMDVGVPGRGELLFDEGADSLTRKLTVEDDGFLYIKIESNTVALEPEMWELSIVRNDDADKWNDDRVNAEEVQPGTFSGAINSFDDTDYLRIFVLKGDTVTTTLNKTPGTDIRLDIEAPGAEGDVAEEDKASISSKVTVEENGFLYIELESRTVTTTSEAWNLSVTRNQGADKWSDNFDTANEISTGRYVGEANSPDDTDNLRYPISRGESVEVALEKEAGDDIQLDVEVPGERELLSNEEGTLLSTRLTAEQNGYLYIEIKSDSVSIAPEAWTLQIDNTTEDVTLPGAEAPAQDPDDDGKYEDVNGDGSVDVIDVQLLFANLDSGTVQDNAEAFDYTDDGAVDVVDVQALFTESGAG